VGLGALSYSLYLWQQLFLDPGQSEWIYRWPQNVIVAFAAALGSYYLVEAPFNRLKQQLGRKRHAGMATQHPPAESRSVQPAGAIQPERAFEPA
jgi:peptidoglycan/LPS O-acetylase OafA/YrhL